MHLSHLQLRHFRNLAAQQLDLPAEGAAIVGENAQGKTNLLEAIYYLETFRSFRGTRDDRLVAFGKEVFRVVGALEGADGIDSVEVAAAFQLRGKRKKVTVDGQEPHRLGDGLGRLAAVIFSPQRNAALRNGQGSEHVRSWDRGLVIYGAQVMEDRLTWVDRWRDSFSAYFRRVSGSRPGQMSYQPGVRLEGARDAEGIGEAFMEALSDARGREVKLGNTVVGPQRDELLLTVEEEGGERDLREYGSGGQRRTGALALRLVEAATIRVARKQEPIVLMDDVFAELDPGRSERILSLMEEEETGQVLLTVPKESDIRLRRESLPRWKIRSGVVER
jgi:DNA replication and repair protein RecF